MSWMPYQLLPEKVPPSAPFYSTECGAEFPQKLKCTISVEHNHSNWDDCYNAIAGDWDLYFRGGWWLYGFEYYPIWRWLGRKELTSCETGGPYYMTPNGITEVELFVHYARLYDPFLACKTAIGLCISTSYTGELWYDYRWYPRPFYYWWTPGILDGHRDKDFICNNTFNPRLFTSVSEDEPIELVNTHPRGITDATLRATVSLVENWHEATQFYGVDDPIFYNATYQGSLVATEEAKGTYQKTGQTYNGFPVYFNGNYYLYVKSSTGFLTWCCCKLISNNRIGYAGPKAHTDDPRGIYARVNEYEYPSTFVQQSAAIYIQW